MGNVLDQKNDISIGDEISVADSKPQRSQVYKIMHGNRTVAEIDRKGGISRVYYAQFMPYDLYLEEEEDIDSRINNIQNFQHWCAARVLTLDRRFAKEIMNSIGVIQAITDKDRADISLAYHCVSLTDIYWVCRQEEGLTFEQINLFDNHLDEALVEIALRGHAMTVTNTELAQDLSTKGLFPKAWIRNENGFQLLKDGGEEIVKRELLASKICQCFDLKQVAYDEYWYKGELVSRSRLVTNKERAIVTKAAFDIYALNHDLDSIEECCRLDEKAYYGMNIVDYLVGNTDRHPENWGLLIDNNNNRPLSLYPLMDFNQSFYSYDSPDGANCQTVLPRHLTQREGALEAVRKVGMLQIKEIDLNWFEDREDWKREFQHRYELLKKECRK